MRYIKIEQNSFFLLNVNGFLACTQIIITFIFLCFTVFTQWLLLLHNFIQLSLNSGSAQVQTLLAACRKFEMVRISDNGPDWK